MRERTTIKKMLMDNLTYCRLQADVAAIETEIAENLRALDMPAAEFSVSVTEKQKNGQRIRKIWMFRRSLFMKKGKKCWIRKS